MNIQDYIELNNKKEEGRKSYRSKLIFFNVRSQSIFILKKILSSDMSLIKTVKSNIIYTSYTNKKIKNSD